MELETESFKKNITRQSVHEVHNFLVKEFFGHEHKLLGTFCLLLSIDFLDARDTLG